jgi:pimeloyl-ACP methyl ester carboxylesterase
MLIPVWRAARVALAAALLVASTAACTSNGTEGSPSRRATPNAGRRVDIGGGRRMYVECAGTGSPTVVLVSGLRSSAHEWKTTESRAHPPEPPVFGEVAKTARVCAYDRPGTVVGDKPSRSDPAQQPTTSARAADELHKTLSAAGEHGPFILVGHSVGGTIVRLYATTFPDEVRGMVLIDPPSEFLQDNETPDQWKIQRKLMRVDAAEIADSIAEYPDIERLDVDASFAQLRAAPAMRPMPFALLSADELLGPQFKDMIAAGAVPAGVPLDFGFVFDAAQAKAQARLAQLVPKAIHITDTKSGHNIHLIQPQLVVDAIRLVTDLSRLPN